MAQLAIKGCEFRGNKVIGILEILGGRNTGKFGGTTESLCYYIDENGKIKCKEDDEIPFPCIYFTLDEFLAKYPYKVGDKVYYDNKVCDVIEMLWNNNLNTISYGVYDGKIKNLAIAEELKPYKEETMEEIKVDIPKGYEFAGVDDDNHQVVFTKIGYHYPKTYEECCKVLGYSGNYNMILTTDVDNKLFDALYRLKVCRDAYWKIAGDWNPDFANHDEKFIIACYYGKIYTTIATNYNRVLVFPTKEMRDAFYENFKELIEQCKELL